MTSKEKLRQQYFEFSAVILDETGFLWFFHRFFCCFKGVSLFEICDLKNSTYFVVYLDVHTDGRSINLLRPSPF